MFRKLMAFLRGLRRGFGWSTQAIIIPPTPIVVPTLSSLSISNSAFNENTAAGTFIGDLGNRTVGSTLSLTDDAGGKVSLVGQSILVGATNADYETTPSFTITVRETLLGATNTPLDTTFTIGVVNLNDTTPSAFTFTDASNVSVSTTQTSNVITVAGLGASDSASAAVSGDSSSRLSKNGGSFVVGPVTVVNGDTVQVRHTSSGSTSTTVNTTLTIGTTSDTFSSVTAASPTLQILSLFNNAFNENTAAGTVIGAILNTTAGSALSLTDNAGNKVAISGSNLTVGATNSDYETVGSSFTCQITETLSGATGSPKATTLTIALGNLNDTNPSAFSFTDTTNVSVSSTQTSNAITVAGLGASDSATATISGSATSLMSYNGGTWQAGPVSGVVNGDTIAVRHTASGAPSNTVNTTLTIGTTSDTFSSTTASPAIIDAPVLSFKSDHVLTTNPMAWQSTYTNAIEWDGTNGDKIGMHWRVNGGSWTTESLQPLDQTNLLNQGFAWPLFSAHTFAGGDFVEVEEWKVRYIGGVLTYTSNNSNTLSDTMAAVAFAPSQLFGSTDFGYAFDTTTAANMAQNSDGSGTPVFTGGIGLLTDLSGKGHNFSQATSSKRPTWQNLDNGLLQFDGVDDELTGAAGLYAKGVMTAIIAVRNVNTSRFFWCEDAAAGGNPIYAAGTRSSGASALLNYQRVDGGGATAVTIAVNPWDSVTHVLTIQDTGTQVKVSIDGAAFVSASYTRGTLTVNQGRFAGAQFSLWNGYIGSSIFIGRLLSGTLSAGGGEITNAYNWVAAKHGKTQL